MSHPFSFAVRARGIGLAGILLLAGAAVQAQDTLRLTLTDALQYGLDNAVSMRESVRTVAEAEQRKREVISRGLPQLSAKLGYTNYVSLPVSILPPELAGLPPDADPVEVQFGVPHNASASAELSQLVFDGAYFLGVKATKLLVDLEVERTKLNEIELRHNTTQSYYTGLIAGLRVTAIKRNIAIVEQLANETRAFNEQGFVEEIEVDRLDRALADLDVALNGAERDYDLALRMLKYTINMDLDAPIALADRLDSLMLIDALSGQEAFNPEDRLEYRLLQRQQETNEINVRYNRSFFLPKLFLFASYEQQAQRETFNLFDFDQPWFEIAIIGANLNIPIFDGFYTRSKVEQAKLGVERVRLQQESTASALRLEVAQARSNYQGALESLESLQASLVLAQKIYNVTQVKYREGVGSSLELVTAQQDFQAAEDQYIAGMYYVLGARADFIKALGKYPTVIDPR